MSEKTVYATILDIEALIRPLSEAERQRAESLLPIASSKLRLEARKYGVEIDDLIEENWVDYGNVIKEITCKAVVRALDSSSQGGAASVVSQESQSALGYVASMTYINAGQSLYILRNELKELGITRQRYGTLDIYGTEVQSE